MSGLCCAGQIRKWHVLAVKPFTSEEFEIILKDRFAAVLADVKRVAVGVSGGPDSMALAHCLNIWAGKAGMNLHALTVDHGLRPDSVQEAENVGVWLSTWEHTEHSTLTWGGDKPASRIQEEARKARYRLMAEYCKAHNIGHLFLAHHQNDQAETVLFRLAKGSGLDGLAAMRPVQKYNDGPVLLRPFLNIPKDRLLALCTGHDIPYIQDPSNESEDFARPRLRKSMAVLEDEGLTAKRLSVTASRLARAHEALDFYTEDAYKSSLPELNTRQVVFNLKTWRSYPEEIAFRVLLKAIEILRSDHDYLPRMEKLENLFDDLNSAEEQVKRTLGGLVFEVDSKAQTLKVFLETR